MALLPSNHFLALPRPDVLVGPPAGVVDTTTLAAHDFDVDTRTGFMPPNPPLARLPSQWEPWEQLLDDAQSYRLQLGKKINITDEEKSGSESWRARVAQVCRWVFVFAGHDYNDEISYRRYPQLNFANQSYFYADHIMS
jgi:indoleamine 2,3-dioxygenase